jgi:2-phospho-L-lactate guanylyltransferase
MKDATAMTAIIPVKTLRLAKRRLAGVLPDAVRIRLVLTMLEDVLAAVARLEEIGTVLVVTPDARVAQLAEKRGATVLREVRAAGLNAAVGRGLAWAAAQGAPAALVLPADVPLATPGELRRLMQAGQAHRRRALLAPAADGDGTNALLLAPPDALEPAFGTGSFLRHLAQAVAKGLELEVLRLPGLAHDMDEPRDLARLLAQAPARYGFLEPHVGAAIGATQRPKPGGEQ